MNQPITGSHQDEEHYWVADLACGHTQHIRHDPPRQSRPWTQTEEGRAARLGQMLDCRKCDDESVTKLP
jgi:cytochrome c-type biogenesis protein CcmH/NrfF